MSHDLRAPIRVVEGFTKILKEDYGRVLDRIGNDHLDRVLGAAARMNGMIDAMLALSRLSAKPLTYQPVNLSQLAGFVVEDLRRQQPERQAEVRIAPDVLAHGDPILLRVALENLLGNAWKYTSRSAGPSRIEFGVEERPLPATSPAPASAWPRCAASCSATAARSGRKPKSTAARPSTSRSAEAGAGAAAAPLQEPVPPTSASRSIAASSCSQLSSSDRPSASASLRSLSSACARGSE